MKEQNAQLKCQNTNHYFDFIFKLKTCLKNKQYPSSYCRMNLLLKEVDDRYSQYKVKLALAFFLTRVIINQFKDGVN